MIQSFNQAWPIIGWGCLALVAFSVGRAALELAGDIADEWRRGR